MSSVKYPSSIVIIDDDPVARMLVKRNFEIAGFVGRILSIDDGQRGFDILNTERKEQFVVVLDYHMPGMDGLAFLKKMEEAHLKSPVFLLSSSIMKSHKEECLEFSNVMDYLIKPINQEKCKLILAKSAKASLSNSIK